MSDQTPDPSAADQALSSDTLDAGYALQHPETGGQPAPLHRPLSLEAIFSSARLVERTAVICLRGDLEDAFNQKAEELAGLVDEDGEVIGGADAPLAEKNRAEELVQDLERLRSEMLAESYSVRFRSMVSDDWEAFHASHRNAAGNIKDIIKFNNELIARCAVEPTFSVADVVEMRKRLSGPQMVKLGNEAYWANTTGGVDIPKSPGYSALQQPQEPSLS